MIAFKVAPPTHQWLSRWSHRTFTAVFIVVAVWLLADAASGYVRANTILRDHGVVVVPVTPATHGGQDDAHFFAYRFTVHGTCYRGGFAIDADHAAPYLDPAATVQIAYANADPGRFERLERLREQGEPGTVLTRLGVEVPAAAVLMYLLHIVLTRLFVGRLPGEG